MFDDERSLRPCLASTHRAPATSPILKRPLTVLALGGNALLGPGERGTAAEHRANLAKTFAAAEPLVAAPGGLVVTHGNGPQVGNELLRHELSAREVPPLPLYVAVAQTQAEIGALMASELGPVAGRPVAVVVTRVVVDEGDPAFEEPTKPIGPFYDADEAQTLAEERGWQVREDAGRGWRRVVPSPRPQVILELEAIRTLVDAGVIVVAAGGGGVPVVERQGRYDGVDAVIDKDHASALLAVGLGADRLVLLTQVDAVYAGFGTDSSRPLRELAPDRDEALLAELPEGSMRPKVEAAFDFVLATGGEALITNAEALGKEEAGTRVVPAPATTT